MTEFWDRQVAHLPRIARDVPTRRIRKRDGVDMTSPRAAREAISRYDNGEDKQWDFLYPGGALDQIMERFGIDNSKEATA